MKTPSRLRRFISFLAVALLLVFGAAAVFAQEPKETSDPGKDGRAPATPSPAYDVEIKDGFLVWNGAPRLDNARQVEANLQNIVDLLRELHPEANFAVSPASAGILIGDLKLRTSSVEQKLEALRIASGSAFQWRDSEVVRIDNTTVLQPSPSLYILDALPAAAKPGLQVEAFNLSAYLDTLYGKAPEEVQKRNAEQLAQIERMVLETVKEYAVVSQVADSKTKSLRTPSIKFHPGAKLVVIIGEPEAVAVAAKVIGALPGAQRSVAGNARENDGSSRESPGDELIKRARPDGNRPAPRP